ncbi:hypothetical protein L9F63_018567, partial [Diploptera punctata]
TFVRFSVLYAAFLGPILSAVAWFVKTRSMALAPFGHRYSITCASSSSLCGSSEN